MNSGDVEIQYADDSLGRPLSRSLPEGKSASGEIDTVTDSRGVTQHHYDVRGRLIRITYPDGSAVHYQYDASGNRTQINTGPPNAALTPPNNDLLRMGEGANATQAPHEWRAAA